MRANSYILLLMSLSFACNKETAKEPDRASEITITHPTSGTIALNGSTLQIRGQATDDNVLASVNCTIRNKNNNNVLYNRTLSTGNVGYFDFAQDWSITGITAAIPARLTVTTTDKVGYIATKEVDFQLID